MSLAPSRNLLRRVAPDALPARPRAGLDPAILATAARVLDEVGRGGESVLRGYAERWDGLPPGAPLFLSRDSLQAAFDGLPADGRSLLEETARRIEAFARAQRDAMRPVRVEVPGGEAGDEWAPVEAAGCYAPGGRYPLPSSVLMTAVPARVAGVRHVWVASPRPAVWTLAAACVAGADGVLAAGGAQAIAALVRGAGPLPACDAVVGPGNAWVTAAKKLVAGEVAIDGLAGPSELVVVADDSADPGRVAADLLAQAEHDPAALPVLVSLGPDLADRVDAELARQLRGLPTAEVAARSLRNGFVVPCPDVVVAAAACDTLAPEHLQLCVGAETESRLRPLLNHFGALFLGPAGAEVFGDYGAGPNHCLPTGGTSRHGGGLSVGTFLRRRTWLRLEDGAALAGPVARLARCEGLEAHARAAERHLTPPAG